MEAARSVREDFLHQDSFHEVDTYTELEKQFLMMKLILAYYDEALAALQKGADIETLVGLEVREAIGRYKYTTIDKIQDAYDNVLAELKREIESVLAKED
jgi:V/A-type H+-transporting ATPase subunit A